MSEENQFFTGSTTAVLGLVTSLAATLCLHLPCLAQTEADADFYFKRAMKEKVNLETQDRAVQDFATAIKLAPKRDDILAEQADLLFVIEEDEEALVAAESATKLNTKNALAWSILGKCLSRMKRPQEGLDALNHAISLTPENRKDQLFDERARLLTILGRYSEAEKDLDVAVAKQPHASTNLADRIEVCIRQKKWPKVIADCDAFMRMDKSHNASIYHKRALAHSGLGQYALAIKDFKSALKESPDDYQIHRDLKAAYLAANDKAAAAKESEIMKALLSDFRWVRRKN